MAKSKEYAVDFIRFANRRHELIQVSFTEQVLQTSWCNVQFKGGFGSLPGAVISSCRDSSRCVPATCNFRMFRGTPFLRVYLWAAYMTKPSEHFILTTHILFVLGIRFIQWTRVGKKCFKDGFSTELQNAGK